MITDLETARDIVAKSGSFVGASGSFPDDTVKAVMQGIAVGRQQAAHVTEQELSAAGKELTYNLSASVRERTEVRRNTAKSILDKIRALP